VLKRRFGGPYIANGGYDRARAEAALSDGRADLVAFGTPYIANPDLVERYQFGAGLNTPDRASFYGGDHRGYIEYPKLDRLAGIAG
jgi:N-ethylmaleimide reductase